jgi:hypothetical protein
MQQVAAPFGCQCKSSRQLIDEIAYPEKHDRWEKDGRFGFGEDQVAGYFENNIL